MPLGLALLPHTLTWSSVRRFVQSVGYLPHFISWLIVVALFQQVLGDTCLLNSGLSRPVIVVGLHGWRDAGAAVAHAAGANACGHHSATPYLTLPAHPGGTHLLVTLVVLSADPEVNGALESGDGRKTNGGRRTNGDPYARGSGTRVRVAVSGEVEIRFPDGTRELVPR